MFDFHKLTVYQKTKTVNKELLSFTIGLAETVPKSLKDQLIRSSSSVLLNIAEGSGRFTNRYKKNFYVIAKGSAYECVALIDIFLDLGYINELDYKRFYDQFEEIVKMLFGLIKSNS